MKLTVDKRAHKFAISVPEYLFQQGEREREQLGISRSEYVARLYRKRLCDLERERKIARYAAAYGRMPATPEEDTLTNASMELLRDEPS